MLGEENKEALTQPSPGVPGEGREGVKEALTPTLSRSTGRGERRSKGSPHPNPLPEYRAEGREGVQAVGKCLRIDESTTVG